MANSAEDPKSRYRHSEEGQVKLDGRSLGFYERRNIPAAQDDIVFTIPINMENRPDLISQQFYSSPKYMWVILIRNKIDNPLIDLPAGKRLSIPSVNRLYSEILI